MLFHEFELVNMKEIEPVKKVRSNEVEEALEKQRKDVEAKYYGYPSDNCSCNVDSPPQKVDTDYPYLDTYPKDPALDQDWKYLK